MKPKKIERLRKRKEVLDLITEKARQYSELVELASFSESTLKRVLEELEKLGLIENEGHYWRRRGYKYPKEYTPEEYNAAVGHTQDLLPGFDALLEINTQALLEEREKFFQDHFNLVTPHDQITRARQERLFLSKLVEQHLQIGYPKIYDNLAEFRRLNVETEKLNKRELAKFFKKFKQKLIGPDRFFLMNWKKKEPNSRLKKLLRIPEQKMFRENIPYTLGPFETEEELAEVTKFLIAPQIRIREVDNDCMFNIMYPLDEKANLKRKVNYFILGPVQIKASNVKAINVFSKTLDSMAEVYGELAKQLYSLKFQVRHQPLDGHCDLCPNIIIKEQPPKNE